MDKYLSFKIICPADIHDLLIAELATIEFDGFDQTDNNLEAFIPENNFNQADFLQILNRYNLNSTHLIKTEIEPRNWNAEWEANYEPIEVDDVCVRAPFHKENKRFKFELIIQPKNTFGTGHHQTTQLMLSLLQHEQLNNATAFDYGCGTGVLGLMALKMEAKTVIGNDIDAWCIDNIEENKVLNALPDFEFRLGDLAVLKLDEKFDFILANINKNILLASFETLAKHLNQNGRLLISGFYESDLNDLIHKANPFGLTLVKSIQKQQWCAAVFSI